MAIAHDASSPSTPTTGNLIGTGTVVAGTSAAFSPPANTLITIEALVDTTGGAVTYTPTNTGTALTWNPVAQRDNPAGGSVKVFEAYNASAQAGITVSLSIAGALVVTAASVRGAFWVDVWTGANSVQTTAASVNNVSTTASISPTVTTTAAGSYVAGVACDDNGGNSPSSTDTFNNFTISGGGSCDGLRAYKSAPSGALGSVVPVNFSVPSAPTWSYIVFEILPAASGAIAGSTAITFGQSGNLTGSGALAGSSSIVFGQSGVLAGLAALNGTTAIVFGASATLTGSGGNLAGSTSIIFGASGTLTPPAGALAGTANIIFGASGAINGTGLLSGTTSIVFGASATANQPPPPIPTYPGPFNGGGGGISHGAKMEDKPWSFEERRRRIALQPKMARPRLLRELKRDIARDRKAAAAKLLEEPPPIEPEQLAEPAPIAALEQSVDDESDDENDLMLAYEAWSQSLLKLLGDGRN